MSPNAKLNLAKANVLVLEQSQQGLEILLQILRGFGVGTRSVLCKPRSSISSSPTLRWAGGTGLPSSNGCAAPKSRPTVIRR